jgi:hypothetical protein
VEVALNPSVVTILAFFEQGVGYALPHPPPYYIDLGGALYESKFENGRLTATVTAPNKTARHSSSGFHFASAGMDEVRKHGETAYDEALRIFARTHLSEIEAKYKDILFGQGPSRVLGEAGFDRNGMAEWELVEVTSFTMEISDTVESTRWDRWLPVVIRIEATYRRLAAVTTTPLTDMSDRDLNEVIDEHMGVESITCDGEIPRSKMPARMRQLRAKYRAYSPRIQTEIWNEHNARKVAWEQTKARLGLR